MKAYWEREREKLFCELIDTGLTETEVESFLESHPNAIDERVAEALAERADAIRDRMKDEDLRR